MKHRSLQPISSELKDGCSVRITRGYPAGVPKYVVWPRYIRSGICVARDTCIRSICQNVVIPDPNIHIAALGFRAIVFISAYSVADNVYILALIAGIVGGHCIPKSSSGGVALDDESRDVVPLNPCARAIPEGGQGAG